VFIGVTPLLWIQTPSFASPYNNRSRSNLNQTLVIKLIQKVICDWSKKCKKIYTINASKLISPLSYHNLKIFYLNISLRICQSFSSTPQLISSSFPPTMKLIRQIPNNHNIDSMEEKNVGKGWCLYKQCCHYWKHNMWTTLVVYDSWGTIYKNNLVRATGKYEP
jgi:hypothetical protein